MSAGPLAKPSLAMLISEPARALFECLSHAWSVPPPSPVGDRHPVVIFPGLATDGQAVRPLRDHCRQLGYAAFDWGRGFNSGPDGDFDRWMRMLADDMSGKLDHFSVSATLIGWSLGGIYARELAKLLAPRVRQVITIATPFNSVRDLSHAGWLLELLNPRAPAADPGLLRRLREPPPVPTMAVYSRYDGVVAWQTCRHDPGVDGVLDVEVSGSHLGMGWNPQVLAVVAARLQRVGGGQPSPPQMPSPAPSDEALDARRRPPRVVHAQAAA